MELIIPTLEQALGEYDTEYLPAKNLGEKTRRFYHDDIVQLINFLLARGVKTVQSIDMRYLNAFQADLDKKELSGYTRQRKASSIRSFLDFLERRGYMQAKLSREVILPKRESTSPRVGP